MAVVEVGSAAHRRAVAELEAGLGPFSDPAWHEDPPPPLPPDAAALPGPHALAERDRGLVRARGRPEADPDDVPDDSGPRAAAPAHPLPVRVDPTGPTGPTGPTVNGWPADPAF